MCSLCAQAMLCGKEDGTSYSKLLVTKDARSAMKVLNRRGNMDTLVRRDHRLEDGL